ncbi:hypothetical protein TH468_05930 [Thalassospira sp. MCCC 1A03138]|nr:hypothetical protein TH468_05930 [Thalassospira sp. MCCC 1A03138]
MSRNGVALSLIKRMLLCKNCAQVAYESGIGGFHRPMVLGKRPAKLPILKVACNLPTIKIWIVNNFACSNGWAHEG